MPAGKGLIRSAIGLGDGMIGDPQCGGGSAGQIFIYNLRLL
jgi:hypothetical protein